MSLRIVSAIGAVLALSCTQRQDPHDAGQPDSGAAELIDGGLLSIGGCTTADGAKFIARFESLDPNAAFNCVLLSFRRFDGGFTPILPSFVPPAGYAMDDARYSISCDFEQPDGRLSTANTAPVTDAWGGAEFAFVFNGRPRTYYLDGGVRLGNRVFAFQGSYAGCQDTCRGN